MAGQNTFPILLLNDTYMIKEHYKTRMKLTQILDLEETELDTLWKKSNNGTYIRMSTMKPMLF